MIRKMLIVDDEEYITNSLYYFFLEKEELELEIYRAYSSREALNICQTVRFDLILMDICMPEMNGIDLMKRIREDHPFCHFVFITGYREFDYAYEILQHTNIYYILKTDGYDRIYHVVQIALENITQQYRKEAVLSNWSEEKEKEYWILRADYCHRLLTMPLEAVSQQGDENILQPEFPCVLLVGRVAPTEHIRQISAYLDQAIRSELARISVHTLCTYDKDTLAWIIQSPYVPDEMVDNTLFQLLEQMIGRLRDNFQVDACLILSDTVQPVMLRHQYEDVEKQLYEMPITANCLILRSKPSREDDESYQQIVIGRLLKYIQDNCTQDISLTTAADYLYYNPSYLSWLFKKQTGQNFGKYLSDCRLEKAYKLLGGTNKKIIQIAEEVGFGSSKYFITIFKKKYGITPQEWRKTAE